MALRVGVDRICRPARSMGCSACANDKETIIKAQAPVPRAVARLVELLPTLQRRDTLAAAQPQVPGLVGLRNGSPTSGRRPSRPRHPCRRCLREQHLAQQIQQRRSCALRVAPVVGQNEPDDESLVAVPWQGFVDTVGRDRPFADGFGGGGWVRHVEPAPRLVAEMLELPGEPLTNLA